MSEIKGNCCDIWTLRGAGAAGAAGPGPDQVGGAEPQPLLGPGALSPPCSRRCGGLWARPTVHSPEFLFSLLTSGAAKHLNASSSFLRPWCSPPPPAAIRSPRGPASTGRYARGGPQPPPPPPARLSDTLPSFRLTPQRGPSPLSSPPRFFHITVPFFLDTHPAPRAAVVLSAQEKQGKERKEPHKAGDSLRIYQTSGSTLRLLATPLRQNKRAFSALHKASSFSFRSVLKYPGSETFPLSGTIISPYFFVVFGFVFPKALTIQKSS